MNTQSLSQSFKRPKSTTTWFLAASSLAISLFVVSVSAQIEVHCWHYINGGQESGHRLILRHPDEELVITRIDDGVETATRFRLALGANQALRLSDCNRAVATSGIDGVNLSIGSEAVFCGRVYGNR